VISARQLNRATLQRQLLLERQKLTVVEAVRRIVALQAQEAASPYIALWNRIRNFDPAELDAAFASHAVVKAQLLRVTLHAVTADDYPPLHEAMQRTLRGARLHDRRFRSEGLTPEDADALIPPAVEYAANPRSNAEMEAWLVERYGAPKPFVWWALRQYGPFVHAVTGPPWSFGPRPAYTGAPEQKRPNDPAASWRYLVLRYLDGFGPAGVADVGTFALLNRPPLHEAFASLEGSGEIVRAGTHGKLQLFDLPNRELPDEDAPAPPRLMAMWDSALLAYAERDRIIPPELRKHVIRSNGDVLPTLLVDGYVAGVWRPTDEGIEATALRPIARDDWRGLDAEARMLRTFLAAREPIIYRRYGRWWPVLPAGEARILGRD
jgi:hypothetical protein